MSEQEKRIKQFIRRFKAEYNRCPKNEREQAGWNYKTGVLITAEEAMFIANALENAYRWIPVTERLPEKDEEVLVYNGERVVSASLRDGEFSIYDEYPVEGVTHWQPLPSPPEGEKGHE